MVFKRYFFWSIFISVTIQNAEMKISTFQFNFMCFQDHGWNVTNDQQTNGIDYWRRPVVNINRCKWNCCWSFSSLRSERLIYISNRSVNPNNNFAFSSSVNLAINELVTETNSKKFFWKSSNSYEIKCLLLAFIFFST